MGMNMKTHNLIDCNKMILIGATGRNSGKTTLATNIIKAYSDKVPIIAFKFIVINDNKDICPRGGEGCGICNSLKSTFDITEELNEGNKDTMLLKRAGAIKVYLIRSLKEHLIEALKKALTYVPSNALILCESNSLRHVVKPAYFIMIKSDESSEIKPSAKSVIEYADIILEKNYKEFSDFVHKLPQIIPELNG